MVVFISGPPTRRLEERLESTRQVHEPVAHEKEHGDERREIVDVAEQNAAPAEKDGDEESAERLAAVAHRERTQERYEVVLG